MTRNERLATCAVFSGTFLLLSAVSLALADIQCNSKRPDDNPSYCVDQWTTCEGQQSQCPYFASCDTGIFGGIQGEYPTNPIKECLDGAAWNKYCGFAGSTTCVVKRKCELDATGTKCIAVGDPCGYTTTNFVGDLPCTAPPPQS